MDVSQVYIEERRIWTQTQTIMELGLELQSEKPESLYKFPRIVVDI